MVSFEHINDVSIKEARSMYTSQKSTSVQRKIPFLLTFIEWIAIWDSSGCLHKRGKHPHQYVMARKGDKGPYSVWNVDIITAAENIRQAHLGVKDSPLIRRLRTISSRKHAKSKLTSEQIAEIRRDYIPMHRKKGQRALAKKYSVHPDTIKNVVRSLLFVYQ